MGIDSVKAQLHAPALVGLQQGLQRQVHMLPQQDGMVCPGGARIHAGQLLQVPGGLELAHPAPLHHGVPCVVDSVTVPRAEDGAGDAGEDGLVHLGIVQLLDRFCRVKAGICRHDLPDRLLLQGRQQEGACFHAGSHTDCHRFRDPMISLHMACTPGKAVTAGGGKIPAEGCRVQGLQER